MLLRGKSNLEKIIRGISFLMLLCCNLAVAQNQNTLVIALNSVENSALVSQTLSYTNTSVAAISTIVLNDWNNSYSANNTLLARRFSDEFVRNFHFASDKERGSTEILSIQSSQFPQINYNRVKNQVDILEINLNAPLAPNESVSFKISYNLKFPSDIFTGYGYGKNGDFNLKDLVLTIARFENDNFIRNSNANLDDIANALTDFDVTIVTAPNLTVTTDFAQEKVVANQQTKTYHVLGKNRLSFNMIIENKDSFSEFRNEDINVVNNLRDSKIDDIQRAIVVDRVVKYVNENLGKFGRDRIMITRTDYERNPFYGLNQLPSFLSPFSNEFIYELKFLKTYTNNVLRETLNLDQRKDNWIFDAVQMYVMMNYMDEFHHDEKMMGNLAKWKILKSYTLINLDFNQQYNYYYMLMARKNLDQPLSFPKDKLIRFNEKIASKYRAGLSLKYLDDYVNDSVVKSSVIDFSKMNQILQTSRKDFEKLLRDRSPKNIDWFFETLIDSRKLIDYKFGKVSATNDSINITVKNKTGATVPMPLYGLKKDKIVFMEWIDNVAVDTTFSIPRQDVDRLVLNYKNEVPEFNERNNYKSLNSWIGNDRPYSFAFMKDLENPAYNQILYVPVVTYNLYDGLSVGLRVHNKTLLEKPFNFDLSPFYAPKTKTIVGSYSAGFNQYLRDSKLYAIKYTAGGSYYHYAPDAAYLKINPTVYFALRDKDFRDNRRSGIIARYNIVHKEKSNIVIDSTAGNYNVLNLSYFNSRSEITKTLIYSTNTQISGQFGKIGGEIQFRRLFDKRQINLRLFAATFLYKKNVSDSYGFGLAQPNDYLFEYNLFGRSENTGILSQQYFLAEGGFKSRLQPETANQWMIASNGSFNVWNWIEVYGDVALLKSDFSKPKFLFDNGIRLNLVTDYFELYFPVYSSNGWEVGQHAYPEKIRFIFTFSPKSLINLFTRKWF